MGQGKTFIGFSYTVFIMRVKVSVKGQIVLPAELRERYGIKAGNEVEVLDFGGEIIIVPVSGGKGRGLLKFRRKLDEIMAEYKREEKEREESKI